MPLQRDTLVNQAYAHLLEIIGAMQPGKNKLPSEEALSKTLGVSRPTIRDVLKRLSKDGYITTIHGIGTFGHPSMLAMKGRIDINADFFKLLQGQYDNVAVENIYHGVQRSSKIFCQAFNRQPQDVYSMLWNYTEAGQSAIMGAYEFPLDIIRSLPAPQEKYIDLIKFSQNCLFHRIAYCTMRLGAIQSAQISKQFGLNENTILLNIKEIIYDIRDCPVGYASCYIHPQKVQLTMAVQFNS